MKNLPYPHAPSKQDRERQFAIFQETFKQSQINIPLAKALEQMPTYAKFMKEMLTVQLEGGCSAII